MLDFRALFLQIRGYILVLLPAILTTPTSVISRVVHVSDICTVRAKTKLCFVRKLYSLQYITIVNYTAMYEYIYIYVSYVENT